MQSALSVVNLLLLFRAQRALVVYAFIESFFSSLKYELVYHHRFATLAQARTAIFDYIETFYNRTRLHSSLDYQTRGRF